MKWFLGVYFCVLFSLVMWSIVLLVKKTENLVFQERQEVRFFPIKRHYSNYLAIYTLFSDLVQHNSIPFSDRVKWTAGYKLPSLIHYFGGLGITSFDFIDMGSVNLAYVKCAFAGGILLTFLIILKCANKFHKTHSTLNSRLTKDLPPLVSGLLFVGIVNSFSSLLFCCTCDQFSDNPTALQACLKQRNGSKEPFLYSYPDLDLTCWSHDHMPMAYIGIMGLTFIVPIGILGAGMSQVLFPLEFLDIKFSPIIGLTSQLVKTISAISALFFTFRTAYMVAIGFATNLFLFCLTLIVNKTSSIWYIGIIKSAIYILSAWTSLCAFVNIFSGAPTSTPIYYLNLGWFVIMSVVCAWLALGLRFRTRRDDRARKERLRDYQLLNNTSESTHPTETEEEMLKQALKLLQTGRLEDVAPRGFMEAAKLRADELLSQSLTYQTNDFIRLSTQSIENPTCSEIMFMRRAKRLSRRATLFGETGQMGVSQGNRSSSNQKAA
ncbi:hypothetical protein AeMF1_010035 [Aphanomyces euteiches]|nr:hypothetical protein AeMF1_010035 [Aphanomyces euteiches]KAH9195359.1 hypothetical protein AeNC1_002669 [Aphanomyces euteiches]